MELLFHGPTALLIEQMLQNIFAYLTIFVHLCPLYFCLYVFKQLSKGCQIYFGVGFAGCQTSFLSIFGKTSIFVQKLQRNQNGTNLPYNTTDGGQQKWYMRRWTIGSAPRSPFKFYKCRQKPSLLCVHWVVKFTIKHCFFFVDLELFHGFFRYYRWRWNCVFSRPRGFSWRPVSLQ